MNNEEDLILCMSAVEDAWTERFSEFSESELAGHLNGLSRMIEGELDLAGFMDIHPTLFVKH